MPAISRLNVNLAANIGGMLVTMLAGFVTMPFLLQRLGLETYGLWSLIAALTGYLVVLDFGVGAAVGRLVATSQARGDIERVNAVMSTAFILLLVVCLAMITAVLWAPQLYFELFAVRPEQRDDVHWALLLAGFNFAWSFPASIFSGMLWGYQRFDLSNFIEIPITILRTVLTFWLIDGNPSLTTLALIIMATNILTFGARIVMCKRVEPALRLSIGRFDTSIVKEIYSFGSWFFVVSLSLSLIPQLAPMVIGSRLGGLMVAPFAVASQLVAYVNAFAINATQIVAPQAAINHDEGKDRQQIAMFLEGGRLSLALALYFAGAMACLGMPFISLWQNGNVPQAYALLLILIAGEILPLSQWVTYSTILGMQRHRRLAGYAIAEAVCVLLFSLILVRTYGVAGVCVAVALAATVFRGVLRWHYGCALLGVEMTAYAKRVFIPIVAAASLPIGLTGLAVAKWMPTTWIGFCIGGLVYTLLYLATLSYLLVGPQRLLALMSRPQPAKFGFLGRNSSNR